MKKISFLATLLLLCHVASFAQCDKNFIINSSKTEYLGADSTVERTVEENTVIDLTRPDITITPGDHKMTAVITSETCNWKTPFIEGATILKATFNDDGKEMHATITIEGKNGKLTLWVQSEEMPRIIRVAIDKFEQKN
ncbi:MAG: hypothetical protein ABIN67_16260 [Ferruginibacter sp.]